MRRKVEGEKERMTCVPKSEIGKNQALNQYP